MSDVPGVDEDGRKKAKSYALRLLRTRPRTTDELRRRMMAKGYAEPLVSVIVADLAGKGFCDDAAFTRVWLRARLERLGFKRVARELKDKGIPADMIGRAWDALRGDYDEAEVVRALVAQRMGRYAGLDPEKRNRRLTDYLLRRGFTADIIYKVIPAGRGMDQNRD